MTYNQRMFEAEIQHRLLDREEAQRMDIAQILHNGPLQEVQALNFALSALSHHAQTTPELAATVERLRGNIQQITRQLRTLCQQLRPPTLVAFGLAAAIHAHAEVFQAQHRNLKLHLKLADDQTQLPQPARFALFNIYQQALLNCAHHAAAQNVHIEFQLQAEQALLTISDDGQGFDVPHEWITIVRAGKMGLVSAIERAGAIGGHLQIRSAPGMGTTLLVTAPRLISKV